MIEGWLITKAPIRYDKQLMLSAKPLTDKIAYFNKHIYYLLGPESL